MLPGSAHQAHTCSCRCLHSYPEGERWQLLLSSLGSTGPAFCLFLGNSKQEALVGACCILPTWLVLWAMNILTSQQPPGYCHYSFHSGS